TPVLPLCLTPFDRLRNERHMLQVMPDLFPQNFDPPPAALLTHALDERSRVRRRDCASRPLPERPAHRFVLVDRRGPLSADLVVHLTDGRLVPRPITPEHDLVNEVGVVDDEDRAVARLREAVRLVEVRQRLDGADAYVVLVEQLYAAPPRVV